MGKVRPEYIKRICKELIVKYPNVFTTSFEENKHLLPNYAIIDSKLIRNRVAGYITHRIIFMKAIEE